MKRIGFVGLLITSLILSGSSAYAAVTPGAKCLKSGTKQTYKGKIYTCIKLGSKLYWNNGKKVSTIKPTPTPSASTTTAPAGVVINLTPDFAVKVEQKVLTASINVTPGLPQSVEKIKGLKVRIFQGLIQLTTKDSIQLLTGKQEIINFTFDLNAIWGTLESQKLPIRVQMEYFNSDGSGKPALKEITLDKNVEATPKLDPTICKPTIRDSLPWASQRIAILSMVWKRDLSGYVSVELKMRNDNSMNLRLVNYSLDYWYGTTRKSTAFNTGTSLVQQFFIKDDPKFMGLEAITGPWKPGQERTFKVETNQLLDCSLISIFLSDFEVLSGIGD
jgi:hypothetical protein